MDLIFKSIHYSEKHSKALPLWSALAAASVAVFLSRKNKDAADKKIKDDSFNGIPSPDGAYYYLGHLPILGRDAVFKIPEWHKKHGPLIRVKMGVQDWLFIGDPQIAHEIFVTKGASTSGRPFSTFGNKIVAEGGRGIILNDYGKNWKNARTAALNILSPTAVQGFRDILWEESGRCVNQLIEQTTEHGEVNPLPYIRLSAVNIMLTIIYGIPTMDSPEDPFYKKIIHIIETCVQFIGPFEDISSFLPILSFLDVILRKERKYKDFWHTTGLPIITTLIDDARKSEKDCLTKKIDLMKDDLELDERNITTLMMELLIAGSDSVSTATLWAYLILCNYREVQEKVIVEIDKFIKTYQRSPTFDDRLELPYFLAVQKECLRFRSINFVDVLHTATEDVVYQNYLIPKGTVLAATTVSMNCSENLYKEPETFMPERYLDNTKTLHAASKGNVNNRDQFTFGWGRRICPGIAMAENEVFNNVIRLLTRCTIEPAISPAGEYIYPDLNAFVDKGALVQPVDSKIRFVLRENRLVD